MGTPAVTVAPTGVEPVSDAELLRRVRALLVDQTRHVACPCGSEALIDPTALRKALSR
jgi:hypothetical protein